jgi:endonuclease/exonuclease/phosphatase family metal-dependent hydrolase
LPDDRAILFGRDHPFLDQVAADMVKLCHHPDAGRLVICGWHDQAEAISFPIENGAHAGASVEETRAFAMLPGHVVLPHRANPYLRPRDLRAAALGLLGRGERSTVPAEARPGRPPRSVRVMTYNVHSCIGMDGQLSPERIARVIAHYEPDVVALQELDVGRPRTGGADQVHLIARRLEMAYHFHPTIRVAEERYGNAILSRMPMRLVKADKLPGLANRPRLEPRGAIWTTVEVDGCDVQIFNTHLGLRRRERLNQVDALLGDGWLGHPDCRGPVVLLGDLNAGPTSPVYRRLSGVLRDAQIAATDHRPKNTWFGPFPTNRIDHVMVDSATQVLRVEVPKTGLTRRASDHLPLLVDLAVDPAIGGSGTGEP